MLLTALLLTLFTGHDCFADDPFNNTRFPPKVGVDFVPAQDDGFHVVYSGRVNPRGRVNNNSLIHLFKLTDGNLLMFGMGYGDTYVQAHSPEFDMLNVDRVVRECLLINPEEVDLIIVVPHWHPDHINAAGTSVLRYLGYNITQIVYQQRDENNLIMPDEQKFWLSQPHAEWTAEDLRIMTPLPTFRNCWRNLINYNTTAGDL